MEVRLFNRQRAIRLPLLRLQEFAAEAAAACLAHPGEFPSVLRELPEVEFFLVSDRTISQVHRRFMNIPGATDVITFAHGEIIISAATAARQARENGEVLEREIARYIIHGLLHLHGHEDADADDSAAMWQAQEQVLGDLWP